jgi:hypothetical protein
MAPAEEPHLRLPAAVIAGELVHEHDRLALAGVLVIQSHAVVGRCLAHPRSPMLASQTVTTKADRRRRRKRATRMLTGAAA